MNTANQEQVASSPRRISEKQMKRYFSATDPTGGVIVAILVLVLGVLLFIIGLASPGVNSGIILGGVIFLIGVGILVVVMIEGANLAEPTDAQYDAWLQGKATRLLRSAMGKLGIDRQTTKGYLQVHGFVLPGMIGSSQYRPDELLWKKGQDSRVRYSVNLYTYFFLAEHSLVVFMGDINALNQAVQHETIKEYFYRDIVGVILSEERTFIGLYQYRVQHLSVRISNGDTIDVSVNALPVDTRQNLTSFTIPDSGIDRTVAQLRSIVREAKQSELPQESPEQEQQPEQE